MYVTDANHRTALELVGDAGLAGNRDEFLQTVLPGLSRLFAADEVSYSELVERPWRVWYATAHPTTPQMLPQASAIWTSRPTEHPWMRLAVLQGRDSALRLSDAYTLTELRAHPYYAEFYRPRGMNYADYAVLGRSRLYVGGVGLLRGRRDFSDAEHDLFEHLRRPLGAMWLRAAQLTGVSSPQPWVDPPQRRLPALTAAEQRIADLVTDGLDNGAIAARLSVSRKAVEQHLTRIYRKAGVRSRTQLVVQLLHR